MTKMKKLFLILISIFLISEQKDAFSQCCTAGNPINTNTQISYNNSNILNVSASYIRSYSDTYYKATDALSKKYIESYFNFLSINLGYSLTDELQLTGDIGYFIDKSQKFVNSDYTRYANGIADAGLGLSYHAFSSEDGLININESAKVTLPIGQFNQEYDGVVLPIDLQPSSGNLRYNFGLMLSKSFENTNFAIISSNTAEFSQAVITDNTYHKYGNLYNASLIGVYKINSMFTGMLQARWEMRERALSGPKSGNLNYLNSSGGVVGYISPQIAFNMMDKMMCNFQFHYPFYKNIYGDEQLTNKYMMAFNISKSLDFNTLFAAAEPNPDEDKSLMSYELWVNGNCEMCEARIKKAVNEVKYVSASKWDKTTKMLKVYYKTTKPDSNQIERAAADVGHDTEHFKADDKVYNNLHSCCLYRK